MYTLSIRQTKARFKRPLSNPEGVAVDHFKTIFLLQYLFVSTVFVELFVNTLYAYTEGEFQQTTF